MKMRQKYSGNKDSKKGRREFESVENKHYLTNNVSKKLNDRQQLIDSVLGHKYWYGKLLKRQPGT